MRNCKVIGCKQVSACIEIFAHGSIHAFDSAVALLPLWGQDIERDTLCLAGGLKVFHELGAAIDLLRRFNGLRALDRLFINRTVSGVSELEQWLMLR
jgi:hypothetical protein